jgi:ABC-type multidrug transport system fused ATPase/permease subunit
MKSHGLLIADLMQRLGWRFPLLIILTALVGVSEGASIVLLLPLLNRMGIVTTTTQGIASEFIDKTLAFVGASDSAVIFVLVIIIATMQTTFAWWLNRWSVSLALNYQSQRQLELFGAFMLAKWAFFVDRKVGEMTNAIVTECARLGQAFTICLSLFGGAIIALVYVVLSLLVAWQVTLSLVAIAIVAALVISNLYAKSYAFGKNLAPFNSQLQSAVGERLSGAKFIKATAGVDLAIDQIEPFVRRLEEVNTLATAMPGTVRVLLEYVALIGLAAILVLGGTVFRVSPANVIVALALFGRLFPRLATMQAQLHALNTHVHSLAVIDSLQSAAEKAAERRDSPSERLSIDQPAMLSVRNLQVRLGDRIVLDDVNLTLPIPGLLALVGKSGAGKSSLVHTLLGLVDPSAGTIRLGDHDLASAPIGAWRRAIGYVPQETTLFHTSIRNNLTLVNAAASEADIKTAARRAHALDFVNLLEDGFDTVIGDQGVKLSGGQRQRLGIARALLMNPTLLVLDEAMSALDAESEAELLRTLEDLRARVGILLVAHRLAAARIADTICVVEAGRIVETGSWNDLMARRGYLYGLATAQEFDRATENVG